MENLIRLIYQIFYSFLFIPVFSLIVKKRGYALNFFERLYPRPSDNKEYIWFHCASVGELNLARPLIERLKENNNILITIFSPRGLDYGKKEFSYAKVIPLPYDLSISIKRFLNSYNIKLGIIIEEEFWFNLITYSSKKFPLLSVNSRVSKNSYKKYKKFYFFYKYIFNSFYKFLVRSNNDFNYLSNFVKDSGKLKLCGDLKYISSIPKKSLHLDKNDRRLIILASSHKGEEEILIKVYLSLRKKYKDLSLIIAPRHLERVKEIEELLKEYMLNYSLRTDTEKIDKDVYILNTLGELSGIYKYADIVVMGGTFTDIGGHNILEAIYYKKLVVVGKYIHKIEENVNEFEKIGLVKRASSEEQLEKILDNLLKTDLKINFSLEEAGKKILDCYLKEIEKLFYN